MASLALSLYLLAMNRAEGRARKILARRQAVGKEHPDRMEERLGHAGATRPGGRLVWIHGASVGEAVAVLNLVAKLVEARPDVHVLLTTGTKTSAEVVGNRLPPNTTHQFVPVDVGPAVDRFLAHWRPDVAVWTESEFWPTLMSRTHRAGVPMLLINARMSKRSHDRWRWMPGFLANLLGMFSHVLAQDQVTARYLRRFSVPRDRIEISGTLKEGASALPHDEEEYRRFVGLLAGRPVWLAASTHDGEEVIAAKAQDLAARSNQGLLLILAPRHPERGPAIAKKLAASGRRVALRSAGEVPGDSTGIYVADTLGEMGLWYRLAPVSFIGGSLVPAGGHNPFEPAALGSAIIHGPHIGNFEDIYQRLSHAGATLSVADGEALAEAIGRELPPDRVARMAHAAWDVCSSGAEVTDRALEVLLKQLEDKT